MIEGERYINSSWKIRWKRLKHAMEVLERYYRSCRRDKVMSLSYIGSSVAQQLLCARITADMHMHNTCCVHVHQVLGGRGTTRSWALLVLAMKLSWYRDAIWVVVVRENIGYCVTFNNKSMVIPIFCCTFALGFGECHFQDIVGKQKHSLLFRV